MRIDKRRADELRPVKIETGYTRYAEGSVLITQGLTAVLCNATVEERLPTWMQNSGVERGWVTAEYAMLPRSTYSRTPRETGAPQARTQEIRRIISRSLRSAVNLNLLGKRQIIVDCDVIQADGGTRTASITGGYMALAQALRKLIVARIVPPGALLAPVAAVSVGIVDGEPLLDLCYQEDARAEVDLNVVMNRDGRYVDLQGTAEGQPFTRADLGHLLDLASMGINRLVAVQEEALRA
jgi:ribonuclease PH